MRPKHVNAHKLVIEATEFLLNAMETHGVTKAELARRMGVSPPAVTRMLSGRNLTLFSVARMAEAIGINVKITEG